MNASTGPTRLSVYVSADIDDLSAERAVAADAIARMRFVPVMSRHPGSSVEACDLFVGIYGGAPAAMGLERMAADYRSSSGLPKLIYVRSEQQRDEALGLLLKQIQTDDQVSYKSFGSTDELRDLIGNDLALILTERYAGTPSVQRTAGRRRLPAPLTPMIARETERSAALRLVGDPSVRLVTLVGPGGIGKTRLALEVARELEDEFDDGVHLVPLAPVKEADLVVHSIARVVGVREGTASSMDAAVQNLSARKLLLILDNFEHLLDAAGDIQRLLAATEDVKVLITSRALLNVRGEHALEVPPLDLPDGNADPARSGAVRLFLERAREVRPDIEWGTDDIEVAAEICQRVDGLPLAIELAAARVRVLQPRDLLSRLIENFDLLRAGTRDLPSRQRTLAATIEWSYRLLDNDEAGLFEALAIFPSYFTLDGAEAIAPPNVDASQLLASLLDKSLLRRIDLGTPYPWFGMLETVRQYALARLEEGPRAHETYSRHAQWLAELVTRAGREVRGPKQAAWLDRAEFGHDSLRAALRWTYENDPATLVRLVRGVPFFWEVRGYIREGRNWIGRALEVCPTGDLESLGVLHRDAGRLARAQGELDEARTHHNQALAAARAAGNRNLEALVLKDLGVVALEDKDLAEARSLSEQALAMARELDNKVCLAEALNNIGVLARFEEDWPASKAAIEGALAVFEEIDDQQGIARALMNLGTANRGLSCFDEAVALYKRSLKEWHAVGGRWMTAQCMEQIALIQAYRGDIERSARLLGAAERLRELVGAPWSGSEEDLMKEYVAKVRTELETSGRTRVWQEGRDMELDEAVELALTV